jgi:hypothetical protein
LIAAALRTGKRKIKRKRKRKIRALAPESTLG